MKIRYAKTSKGTFSKKTLNNMFRFRHHVFYKCLRWEVNNTNGMEIDEYDALDPYYMVVQNEQNEVTGCWRMLPTTGPYMLKNTFPQLLHGLIAPEQPNTWELSRFAVKTGNSQKGRQAGLNQTTFSMIKKIVEFADAMDISQYVTVISLAVERMLRQADIPIHRIGNHRPQKIGKVLTLSAWIDVEELRYAVHNKENYPFAA